MFLNVYTAATLRHSAASALSRAAEATRDSIALIHEPVNELEQSLSKLELSDDDAPIVKAVINDTKIVDGVWSEIAQAVSDDLLDELVRLKHETLAIEDWDLDRVDRAANDINVIDEMIKGFLSNIEEAQAAARDLRHNALNVVDILDFDPDTDAAKRLAAAIETLDKQTRNIAMSASMAEMCAFWYEQMCDSEPILEIAAEIRKNHNQ